MRKGRSNASGDTHRGTQAEFRDTSPPASTPKYRKGRVRNRSVNESQENPGYRTVLSNDGAPVTPRRRDWNRSKKRSVTYYTEGLSRTSGYNPHNRLVAGPLRLDYQRLVLDIKRLWERLHTVAAVAAFLTIPSYFHCIFLCRGIGIPNGRPIVVGPQAGGRMYSRNTGPSTFHSE